MFEFLESFAHRIWAVAIPVSDLGTTFNDFFEDSGDAAADSSTTYSLNINTGGAFSSSESFSGSLSSAGDEDWIKLRVQNGSSYRIVAIDEGGAQVSDLEITAVDADGNEIFVDPF